jgi:RNA polymerase sigma factor (sigma-70 family)
MSSMQDLPGLAPLAPVSPPADVPARPRLRAVPDVPLDFDDAVRTLTPRLVRYATRRLGDVHEAEEVVQEALLRAYKHREELLTEDDLAAWSTCVTGRLVIDRLRVRGRSTSVAEVPEGTRVGRDTADVVVARDEARTALDALDAMPPRQAAVLWAREVEGLAYDEIGVRFGMTEPAVRSILTRARKALRKEYAARGGTLPAGGLAAIAPWADGLGWLERLRGAVGRVTAPAALGVVTTGLLAGGLLTVPGFDTVTPAPPAVTTTVVTSLDTPVALHIPAERQSLAVSVAITTAPAATRSSRVESDGKDLEKVERNTPCVDADDLYAELYRQTDNTIEQRTGSTINDLNGPLMVGPPRCGDGEAQSTYFVNTGLPENSHVPTSLGVSSDDECWEGTSQARHQHHRSSRPRDLHQPEPRRSLLMTRSTIVKCLIAVAAIGGVAAPSFASAEIPPKRYCLTSSDDPETSYNEHICVWTPGWGELAK